MSMLAAHPVGMTGNCSSQAGGTSRIGAQESRIPEMSTHRSMQWLHPWGKGEDGGPLLSHDNCVMIIFLYWLLTLDESIILTVPAAASCRMWTQAYCNKKCSLSWEMQGRWRAQPSFHISLSLETLDVAGADWFLVMLMAQQKLAHIQSNYRNF